MMLPSSSVVVKLTRDVTEWPGTRKILGTLLCELSESSEDLTFVEPDIELSDLDTALSPTMIFSGLRNVDSRALEDEDEDEDEATSTVAEVVDPVPFSRSGENGRGVLSCLGLLDHQRRRLANNRDRKRLVASIAAQRRTTPIMTVIVAEI